MIEKRKALLVFACFVVFMDTLGYGMVIPNLPIFAEMFNASKTEVGFLFASYAIATFFFLLPCGILTDRWGAKPFVVSGMFFLSLSCFLFAFPLSFSQLFISRLLQGVAASMTWAAALPMAAKSTEGPRRGLAMSSLSASSSLGFITGPIVGGLGKPGDPFLISSLLTLVMAFVSMGLLKDDHKARAESAYAFWPKIKELLKRRNIQIACLVVAITDMAFGLLEALLPLHMDRAHQPRRNIGLLFGSASLSYVAFQPVVGFIADKRGRLKPILLGLILLAALLPIPCHLFTIKGWAVVFAFLGMAGAFAFAPSMPLVADSSAREEQGVAYGLYNSVFSIGYIAGPGLGGLIADKTGRLDVPFYICSLIVFLGMSFIWMLSRRPEGNSVKEFPLPPLQVQDPSAPISDDPQTLGPTRGSS